MLKSLGRTAGALLLTASVVLVAPARALVDCTGSVTSLSVQLDSQGIVTLALSGGPSYTYLCAINAEQNGVAAAVCRTMYATLMAAKLTGKRVLIRFHDHSTCASVPSWAWAGQLSWTQVLLD